MTIAGHGDVRREYLGSPGFSGGLFAAAVAAFCLHAVLRDSLGLMGAWLAVLGNATCAWSWLVVRSTFRPAAQKPELWPLAVVVAFVMAQAIASADWFGSSPLKHMIGNLCGLVSSAMLLLAAIEPLRGLAAAKESSERAFRLIFTGGYVAILAIAVIWVDGAPDGTVAGRFGDAIKAGCAFAALAGIGSAIWFRARHPMTASVTPRSRPAAENERALAAAISALLADKRIYTDCELRVAGLARMVGEQEYKVTQCITGALGFPNFNQMLNRYRIDEAMRRLSDPALNRLPILTIALDCGFGSIGPFNRAFKAQTGMTPMQYRAARGGAVSRL